MIRFCSSHTTVCINVKETQDLNYNMWQLLSGAVPWRTVSPCLRANLALHFVLADWFGTNLARTVKVIQNVPWFPPPGQNHRRKFRSQTSDNMDRWKAQQGRGREKRKIRRKKSRRERVRRKKMEMREKVGKSRNTVFFQWFGAPEGRKVGSLKRQVRSQLARWEMKNCTPLWREEYLQVKMYKTPQLRTPFGSCDVEKVHAVVARSTFPSQNVQKHTILGPLLEVAMSKKCTPLWREAHFQVKMYKTHQVRTTFGSWDVEKVHAVVARSTFPSENVQNTTCSRHFWRFRCRKSARRCGAKHISKWKCTKH